MFGKAITLSTFGESHGPAMGGVLEGLPPRVYIDRNAIQDALDRRRPGNKPNTSPRKESDKLEILSGISPNGLTYGSPIGFIIRNVDARSADYNGYTGKFRPNHADFTYYSKYGIHDFRGGGRASARETVSWVAAGALCAQWLAQEGIEVNAEYIATHDVSAIAADGDSAGGIVQCSIKGLPVGIGEPVFNKFHARLAEAMMSINAAKAFEYGDGFKAAYMTGSSSADIFVKNPESRIYTKTNHSGGVQGGITNGMPVNFRVYFKPTPTIMQSLPSIDTEGRECMINPAGRHDPCVAIRAVAVVEAMTWLTIADLAKLGGFFIS